MEFFMSKMSEPQALNCSLPIIYWNYSYKASDIYKVYDMCVTLVKLHYFFHFINSLCHEV